MNKSDEDFSSFCKELPKVELHAHLNGSLSEETLKKLILLKAKKSNEILETPQLKSNDLAECFQVFGLIHKITDTPEAVYLATCDVIKDFNKDGVKYLELRSTPKEVGSQMTQEIYVESVLKAIQDTCFNSCPNMWVNLLLSIDRKRPVSVAEEMMKIAEKYAKSSSVVGIDFSGDPQCGDIRSFIPLLEYSKKVGLKLAIHISEIPQRFEEVERLLNLYPDRLGHGTFLHPLKGGSVKNFELLQSLQIPLEICLTSNIISKTVPSYQDHHFKLFKDINYPCVLCTDDKGIFNTTLSNEYHLASKYFSLTKEDLYLLSCNSINYIFGNSQVQQNLKLNLEQSYKRYFSITE